jgi:hypothetical protein
MFKVKILISGTIFFVLLVTTSIIKNQTRVIEKKLNLLSSQILLKEKDFNESQLDFSFLTSPSQIEKKIKNLGHNHYLPVKKSNVFLSLSSFTSIQKKISILDNHNEKKTKKN